MTEHLIDIRPDTDYLARLNANRAKRGLPPTELAADDLAASITCLHPDRCTGWIECSGQEHPAGSEDGPYDCEEDAPWEGADEFEFHGELHTWRDSYGWTVPYVGCVVQGADYEIPDELRPLRIGRWIVEDEWDETDVYLTVVREAADEDVPDPVTAAAS